MPELMGLAKREAFAVLTFQWQEMRGHRVFQTVHHDDELTELG